MESTQQRLLKQLGDSDRLRIVELLKRSCGMTVQEISRSTGFSYFVARRNCVELQRKGLLESWRRPVAVGRPEVLYRLTAKANQLFPQSGNRIALSLLEEAARLYGPAAPEKLLYSLFESRTASYKQSVGSVPDLLDRIQAFVKIRSAEGCMSEVIEEDTGGWRIREYHSPLMELLERYPLVARLEVELVSNVLEVPVRREEIREGGQCRFEYIPETEPDPLNTFDFPGELV